jgi:hypothetical protein
VVVETPVEEQAKEEAEEDVPELEALGEDDSSDDDDEEEVVPRQSARIAGGILKPDRYAMATRIAKSKLNSEERNMAIEKAEAEEI